MPFTPDHRAPGVYFRFPLSLRMVEDMLVARGIIVSHQTARLWAEKFGRTFANEIRHRSSGRLGDRWHLDDAVISIRGKKHWLWPAVDQSGFVLEVLVQSRRNAKAAKRRPGIYCGRPSVVVDNSLDRPFDVAAPDRVWVTDIT